ncbi:MAG TPA: hypothetical protein VK081_00755 [Planctomycetota bacterium]|nr:hypothetical protein [Planctomycetota bacterium]
MTRPALPLRKKLLFALVPLLAVLLVLELVARVLRAPLHFGSFRELRVDQVKRGYPAVHHDRLGYVPRADFAGDDNHWGTRVTIDADGFRSNGAPPPPGRPIIAVGDSFTFGDQVDDDETWPAYLERRLQQPVKNAGVFGYSLTQAILRAEDVLERVPAEWLVVSLIPDDINRSELAKRYAPVPWFDVVDGALVLRNVPVQDTSDPDELRQRRFKDILGHSALLDAVLAHVAQRWWIVDQKEVRAHPPGKGAEIALLLVDRVAATCRGRNCRVMFVLQGEESTPAADAVLVRAREKGLIALDLVAAFRAELARDPDAKRRLFAGHMTPEGNAWVAEHVAAAIQGAR